jgi:hypothetical protein
VPCRQQTPPTSLYPAKHPTLFNRHIPDAINTHPIFRVYAIF